MREFILNDYENITPTATIVEQHKEITLFTPHTPALEHYDELINDNTTLMRWISSIPQQSSVYDIGAFYGLVSLWLAITKHCQVCTFEPEAQNNAVIDRNLQLNQLSNVTLYPLAISDRSRIDTLHLPLPYPHTLSYSIGEPTDYQGIDFNPQHQQGCYSITLDRFTEQLNSTKPAYLRIHSQGFSHKVIAGAEQLLKEQCLRSILIDLDMDHDAHDNVVEALFSAGFKLESGGNTLADYQRMGRVGLQDYIFVTD